MKATKKLNNEENKLKQDKSLEPTINNKGSKKTGEEKKMKQEKNQNNDVPENTKYPHR